MAVWAWYQGNPGTVLMERKFIRGRAPTLPASVAETAAGSRFRHRTPKDSTIDMKPTFLVMQNFGHPLFKTVDFTKAIGHFVVVDPMDPSHLLYLTPRGYQDLLKVIISNDGALVVLARPEDNLTSVSDPSKPSTGSSDQHNPPIGEVGAGTSNDLSSEASSPPETLDKGQVSPSMPHPLANAMTREEFESLSESTKRDIERHFRVKRFSTDFSSIWETAKNQFARFLYRGLINPESRFLGLSDRNIRNLFLH